MRKRFRFLMVAAVVVAVLAGGVVFAQGPGSGRGGRLGGPGGFGGPGMPGMSGLPIAQLNLSEAQREQIRNITARYREQNRQAAEQLRTAMEAQRQAVQTIPVNEGLIHSTAQALVAAQTELAIQQARMQSEIFLLLTPDQQEQAKKLQADREARMQQQRERMEQRRQPRQ